jgi:cytochrome P450
MLLADSCHLGQYSPRSSHTDRAGLAMEEFLRFISVVQFAKPRFVRKDIELDVSS